ncbi:MAG: MarR family winged helix-turn-helix transcriptional regulator [Pigmentiphaga sp.]
MMQDNYLSPAAPDANTQAFTDLVWLVFRLNGTLLHWGDALVEPLGLTGARWQMLGVISLTARPLTAPQIGQAMGVTRQGAQKQLNLLLEQGLVESRPNPAHQRSPLYALTPRGYEVHEQAVTLWMERASEIASQLSPTNTRGACTTLEAMLHHFSSLEK